MKHARAAFVAALALAALSAPGPSAGEPVVTVVMSGLDNPRGLAFGANGALYVAEAGRGGLGMEAPFCFTGGAGGLRCYGATGAISRLWHGQQQRVVVGLPSQARRVDGGNAIGPHDVAMMGNGIGSAHVTIGWMQAPGLRDQLIAAGGPAELADFGWLVHVLPNGGWRQVARSRRLRGGGQPRYRESGQQPVWPAVRAGGIRGGRFGRELAAPRERERRGFVARRLPLAPPGTRDRLRPDRGRTRPGRRVLRRRADRGARRRRGRRPIIASCPARRRKCSSPVSRRSSTSISTPTGTSTSSRSVRPRESSSASPPMERAPTC